jgi:anti-anti-sigma regulatory factor
MLGFYSRRHPSARIVHLNFNTPEPVQQARRLVQDATCAGGLPPCLLIDCRELDCLRTRGLGYFVAQLLLIHRAGAGLLLHNVGESLARQLQLLRLDALVELTRRPAAPARAVRRPAA